MLVVLLLSLMLPCLYTVWTYWPVVIVYGGATTRNTDYKDIVQRLQQKWPLATIVVLCPMETIGKAWWAEPQPSCYDIQYYAQWYDDREAYMHAHAWATAVNDSSLRTVLAIGLSYVVAWRRLFVVGFSNGCVPAQDLVFHAKADGVWMASGLPADHQSWTMLANVSRKVATVSTHEKFFGGSRRMQYYLQSCAGFKIFTGGYRHGREDTVPALISAALAQL